MQYRAHPSKLLPENVQLLLNSNGGSQRTSPPDPAHLLGALVQNLRRHGKAHTGKTANNQ